MYPVVFFDALRGKIREDAVVHNNGRLSGAGHSAQRYNGMRDILDLWIEKDELTSAQSALPARLACRVDVLFCSEAKGEEMADSGRMRQVDAFGMVASSHGKLVVRQESNRP